MSDLRLVSYLAPSLPEGLFVAVATRIAEATGLTTSLRFQIRTSAPPPGEVDPFSSGEADIGFLCSPGYVWMTDLQPPAVRLLAAAPVFDDPRTEGRPVYFSDVVVAHGSPAIRFEDLRGGTWAFNDPCSWSGYLNLLVRLRDVGGAPFFRGLRESGSHLQSIRLIATAQVLRAFGVLRFAPVADEEYAAERAALRRWQSEQQAARLSNNQQRCAETCQRDERDAVWRVDGLARSGIVVPAVPSTGFGTIRERRQTQQGSSA